MPTPTAEDVIQAFVRALHDQLTSGNTVEVPDLGRFRIEHEPSRVEENDDGDAHIQPPRDVVSFSPDEDHA